MENVTSDTFDETVLKEEGPVLVDFWAPWCPPCRAMEPNIQRLALDHPGLTVVKADIDAEPALKDAWGVSSIPTLVVFLDGQEVARRTGAASYPILRDLVAPFLPV